MNGNMDVRLKKKKMLACLASHCSQILSFCMTSSSRSTCDLLQASARPKLRPLRRTRKLVALGQLKVTFYHGAVLHCWKLAVRLQSCCYCRCCCCCCSYPGLPQSCLLPLVKSPNSCCAEQAVVAPLAIRDVRLARDQLRIPGCRPEEFPRCFKKHSSALPAFCPHWFYLFLYSDCESIPPSSSENAHKFETLRFDYTCVFLVQRCYEIKISLFISLLGLMGAPGSWRPGALIPLCLLVRPEALLA